MSTITVRKINEKVKAKLRIRAAQHGHSMEEEIREILAVAVEDHPQRSENLYEAIRRRMAEAGIDGIDLPQFDRGMMRGCLHKRRRIYTRLQSRKRKSSME